MVGRQNQLLGVALELQAEMNFLDFSVDRAVEAAGQVRWRAINAPWLSLSLELGDT